MDNKNEDRKGRASAIINGCKKESNPYKDGKIEASLIFSTSLKKTLSPKEEILKEVIIENIT
jgi:hypothetical protein